MICIRVALIFELPNFELLICTVVRVDEKTLNINFQPDPIIFRPPATALKLCILTPTSRINTLIISLCN